MTREEWIALERGDQITYAGKDEIWEVDHPASVSKKKEMMNKYPIDEDPSNGRRMAENCPGGGGECKCDGMCVRASMIMLNGRGAPRHSQTFDNPENWTKVN